MGRKTSKRAPPKKKGSGALATQFACPFCNHDKSCVVKIKHEDKIGVITCNVCSESFQTVVNHLSEPIDVYTDWIDECERVNDDAQAPPGEGRTGGAGERTMADDLADLKRDESSDLEEF